MELGSLHSGRDVVRLGGQQIENAILGNFEKSFHSILQLCLVKRIAWLWLVLKKRQMSLNNEHSCKIAPTLLSFSLASMCKAKATL